jgi:hypothetical protein
MLFIPIDEWLSKTARTLHSRSDALKALDAAIARANQVDAEGDATLVRYMGTVGELSESAKLALLMDKTLRELAIAGVRRAFTAWVKDGHAWRTSVRNQSGAVTLLHQQLSYWQSVHPSPDTSAALAVVIKARNESIPTLFAGCECIAKGELLDRLKTRKNKVTAAKNVVTVARNSYKLSGSSLPSVHRPSLPSHHGSGASSGLMGTIETQVGHMVKEAFGATLGQLDWHAGEAFLRDMLNEALASIKEEVAALAPGVGLGAASATLVFHTVKLVMSGIAADEMLDLSRKLETGDSMTALQRVRDWQLRDIALRTSKVARASVSVGTHAAAIASCGVGIPAQLAIGIANAIIALAEMIADLGVQYKESRALTAYLNGRSIDAVLGPDIFAASPLAGAYYLLNTPTSHIALQLVTIGAPAWQEDVELLKKSGVLKTVITESARLIDSCRYRIVRSDGGRYREREGKTLAVKAKELVGKQPLRGKTKMESVSSSDAPVDAEEL